MLLQGGIYIDILIIIITLQYSTCISSFFGSRIPTSLFIYFLFFVLYDIKGKVTFFNLGLSTVHIIFWRLFAQRVSAKMR